MILNIKEDEFGKYIDLIEVMKGLFTKKDQKRIEKYSMEKQGKEIIFMFFDKDENVIKPKRIK